MENKKVLSVIYSCNGGAINTEVLKEAGFSEERMEIICVEKNRGMAELKDAAAKATGAYVTFVRESDELQKNYFEIIANKLDAGYCIYSTMTQKLWGESKFFSKMYADEMFDYVDVREESLKVLSGLLGTVIRREDFLKYAKEAVKPTDEALIVTKLVLKDGKYGVIPAKLRYENEGSDYIVCRNQCNRPEAYENIVEDFYEKILELKQRVDDGFHRYLDALLTVDIFFHVNGGAGVDQEVTMKYLEEIVPVTAQISDSVFSSEKINFISANKRTYLLLKYKVKGEIPSFVYNKRGMVFFAKDIILRRIASVPAQIYKAQMEGDYLYLEGKIDFNLSLKDIDLVISRTLEEADLRTHLCKTEEVENVGETVFGQHITKTLIFKGKIRMEEEEQIIELSFRICGTSIPLNLKIVKNSQAERYFSSKKEYDNYILEHVEKKELNFVKNTKENLEQQIKKQNALWKFLYGKEKTEKILENIKKYKRMESVFSKNNNLLVTCGDEISPEIRALLKQQKDVKVRVCSISGKEIDGFKNIKFGSRKHRFAYMYDRYELSLLNDERKYSAFGRDRQFYEGIRKTKVYELK